VPAEETFEPEEVREVDVSEGKESEKPTKVRQRSQKLRDLAREHFRSPDGKLRCAACEWTKPAFQLAHEIIEIHHTEEMSTLPKAGRKLTLAEALALLTPLCPTCHRMLHAKPGGGSFTVEELREHLRNPPA
jgi:predicted HNH restriction endonuclease